MAGQSVLIVEDDENTLAAIRYVLEREGYTVSAAITGPQAVELARSTQPDIVLLDIMLPEMDGFQVCRMIRQESDVPIVVLSARADEFDRVLALEIGADDYVAKPFSLRELVARLRARLRRGTHRQSQTHAPEPDRDSHDEVFHASDLEIDLRSHTAKLRGFDLELKPREFELLKLLVRNTGRVCTRDYILEDVWGSSYSGSDHTIAVHIRWLREKIEQDPNRPIRIKTVRGTGYRFEG